MRKIIILVLLLNSISGFCQQSSFNKVYAPFGVNPPNNFITATLAACGNGWITAAVGNDTIKPNLQSVIFFKIDSVGNFTRIKNFTPNDGYWNIADYYTLSNTHDSGFIFTMLSDSTTENHSDIIMRFNSNLDTLWTKSFFPRSPNKYIINTVETSDHGFICIGMERVTNSLWDLILIKTDSIANKIWEKRISIGKRCFARQITVTPDKGYLIAGIRGSGLSVDSDPFVIKTDSIGNVNWCRIFGNPLQKDGGIASAISNHGDYLIAYGYGTYTYPSPNEHIFLGRLNVIKLDSNGYTIWDKIFDTVRLDYSVYKIQILPNNDFIVMGSASYSDFQISSMYISSYLFRFNANGDSIYRKIYKYSENIWDFNYLYDNVLNPDGSTTAIGYVQADTMHPYQKIWIVKTDTNLYAPGCSPTNVSENYYTQKGELQIFPNPATTQTTISYPIVEKAIMLQIYNILGQKVYEEKLSKGSSQTIINTSGFNSGLYKVVAGESSGSLIIN